MNCLDGTFCKTCKTGFKLDSSKKTCSPEKEYYQGDNLSEGDDITCHPYCKDCDIAPSSESMNCIKCQENLYKINGTQNCYDDSLLNKGYYFKDDMYYPCDVNCLTCSDGKNETSNNCLSCDSENKNLYLLEDIKNCEKIDFPGYYLMENSNVLKKCNESCKTCVGPYEIYYDTKIENHNCIECADNYYKLPNGSYPNNCYDNDTINSWKNIEETILNISNISPSIIMNEISSNIMEETIKGNEYSINNINNNYKEIETTSIKFKTSYYDIGTTISSEEKTTYKLETTSNNKETTYYHVEPTSNNIEPTSNIIRTSIYEEEATTNKLETTNINEIGTTFKNKEDTTYKVEHTSNNFIPTFNDIESISYYIETFDNKVETTFNIIETNSYSTNSTSILIESTSKSSEKPYKKEISLDEFKSKISDNIIYKFVTTY